MVNKVREVFRFLCSMELWRMAIMWTIALVASYLQILVRSLFSRKSESYQRFARVPSSFQHVCIITGAASGLGAAAARALTREGFTIVMVGRSLHSLSKTVAEIQNWNKDSHLKAFEVDLSSFCSICHFMDSLQQWLQDSNMHLSVQLLINNAGILATSPRTTIEGYDEMMATNYIGPFCLTQLLLPLLRNSLVPSKIVNVSSFTHRSVHSMQVDKHAVVGKCFLRSKNYPFAQVYEYSKICVLLFSYELHRRIGLVGKANNHVSVIAVDPGVVKTNIMREIPPFLSNLAFALFQFLGLLHLPDNGAKPIIDAALSPPEVSGEYFFGGNGRTIQSSALSYDPKLARELWATSSDLFDELRRAFKEG